jgi:diaminopimelate decarboxylase
VPIGSARTLYAKASGMRYLKVAGVSVHIGSQITDVAPFAEAVARVADFVRELRADGHRVDYVDTGGGLGIAYQKPGLEFAEYVANYSRAVTNPLRGLNVHLLLEPGRSIVGPAGVLLTSVLYRKENDGKRFLVVDAAMNDLIRPALYNAYHEIVPVVQSKDVQSKDVQSKEVQSKDSSSKREVVDVVGPVCESGDFFARDRELPRVEEGDLLAILDAGAYGMVLASNYNTRPRPAEVLVNGKSVKIIRRREKVRELYSAEL